MIRRLLGPAARGVCPLVVLAFLSGCSTMHLGRAGGVASPTAANEPAKPAKHGKAGETSADPLAEARLHAAEEPSEPWWPYREAE